MTSSLSIFTLVHVVISLVGIASGVIVAQGLLTANRRDRWTAVFLAGTLATFVTGFGFPFEHVLPSHVVGLLSIVLLVTAIVAPYTFRLDGRRRSIYLIGAVVGLYLNVFVLIAQAFLKVPALKAIAPTQSESPFAITQLVALVSFVVLGIAATRRFRPVVGQPRGRAPVAVRQSFPV